jgi:DNA primase
MKHPVRPRVEVPALLESLGIVVVKREGRHLKALCPIHDDTSPDTWSIVDDPGGSRHGYWWCFACDKGGGPGALVRALRPELDEQGLRDFLAELPARQSPLEVDIQLTGMTTRSSFVIPSEVMFGQPLSSWPEPARAYLEGRSITEHQVVRYRLGYAVQGRLEGRIVLPMCDANGPRSYTARDFTGQGRRYREPATRENAAKDAIFGEHTWSREPGAIVVIEGCFDALSVENALPWDDYDLAALHGSSLHPSQAVKLSRFPRVVVATDNDPAGNRIADELEDCLSRYCAVVRALPPAGEDYGSLPPDITADIIGAALG